MSLRPLPLAVFFPPEPETKAGADPSELEQEATSDDHAVHRRTKQIHSDESSEPPNSSTQGPASSDTWPACESGEGEECWDEGEGAYQGDEQDEPALLHAHAHVWTSDEERLRIAFRRAKASAEKVDLDKSPFFPKTVAEYVGLKADGVEAKAARLRARVEEKERALRGRENGRWEAIVVVGPSGQIEERLFPVYFGGREEPCSSPLARPPAPPTDAMDPTRVTGTSSTHHEHGSWHQGDTAGSGAQANGTFAYNPASSSCAHGAAEHQRACSALFLREIASHAAARRADLAEGVIDTDDGRHNGQGWVDDSDDSFTPSDYRPKRNRRAARRKDESHDEGQDNASRSDGSFTPSEYRLDNFKFYQTPDGEGHLKGKKETAEENHMRHGQVFVEDRYQHTQDQGDGRAEYYQTRHEKHAHEHEGNVRAGHYDTDHDAPFEYRDAVEHKDRQEVEFSSSQHHGFTQLEHEQYKHTREGERDGKAGPYDTQHDASPGYRHTAEEKGKQKAEAPSAQYHDLAHLESKRYKQTQGNGMNDTTELYGAQHDVPSEYRRITGDKGKQRDGTPSTQHHDSALPPSQQNTNQPGTAPSETSTSTTTSTSTSTFTPSDYNPSKLHYNPPPVPPVPPLPTIPPLSTLRHSQADHRTALFAHLDNPFTPFSPSQCDWPSVAEYTSEGGGRIKRADFAPFPASFPGVHPSHTHSQYQEQYQGQGQEQYECQGQHQEQYQGQHQEQYQEQYQGEEQYQEQYQKQYQDQDQYHGQDQYQYQGQYPIDIDIDIMEQGTAPPPPNLGRFLPIPRLRDTVDPRLGFTTEQVTGWLVGGVGAADGNGAAGDGMVPWEMRAMAGERWDLHGARRIWEVWARGGGVRFEDEEDGWDVLEGSLVGVVMAGELVGEEEEEVGVMGEEVSEEVGEEVAGEEEGILEGMVRDMVEEMLQEEEDA